MKLLLDTHAFLWIAGDWKQIREPARKTLSNVETELFLSVASLWEIVIKASIGRLILPLEPTVFLPRRISDFGISTIAIAADHAFAVSQLAPHHADPFDRMIIAQARVEGLRVATRDRMFAKYGVDVLRV